MKNTTQTQKKEILLLINEIKNTISLLDEKYNDLLEMRDDLLTKYDVNDYILNFGKTNFKKIANATNIVLDICDNLSDNSSAIENKLYDLCNLT